MACLHVNRRGAVAESRDLFFFFSRDAPLKVTGVSSALPCGMEITRSVRRSALSPLYSAAPESRVPVLCRVVCAHRDSCMRIRAKSVFSHKVRGRRCLFSILLKTHNGNDLYFVQI